MTCAFTANYNNGLPLLELRPRACRWPVTKQSPHLFCGADTDLDSRIYCTTHRRLSLANNQPRNVARMHKRTGFVMRCLEARV